MSKNESISSQAADRILRQLTTTHTSVNQLATRSGIPRPTLDRNLKVTPRRLTLGQLEDIADSLDVSLELLLGVDSDEIAA